MRAVLRWLCELLVRLYYPRITVEGERALPQGVPILFVLNHPNALLDPMVLRLALRRPVRFLAKSTLFGNPIARYTMDAFGAIPVYRRVDVQKGGGDPQQNEATFARCTELLAGGADLAIFPEGTSHSDPMLKPLKTGAARIALSTLARSAGAQLAVVPVGLHYEDKRVFRTWAHVVVGEPLELAPFARSHAVDPEEGVRRLTAAIKTALDDVLLQAETRQLLEGVAHIAVWTGAPELKEDPAAHLKKTRELVLAYQGLGARDPARAQAISTEARRYMRILKALGIADPWALEGEPLGFWRGARAVIKLVLLLPPGLCGALLGWVPYRLAGRMAAKMTRDEDELGTIKLLAGALFVVGAWTVEAVLVGILAGGLFGAAAFGLAAVTGYLALRLAERWTLVREGTRYLLIRARRAELVAELTRRRHHLALEVERALAEATASSGPSTG